MRIWSIHPKHLDTKGLVALWRETLLAKNVLEGKTKGYKNHPQLNRFKMSKNPHDSIHFYLEQVWIEAKSRGYNFDAKKFVKVHSIDRIPVTRGQLSFEATHLINKLKQRDTKKYNELSGLTHFDIHTLFRAVDGQVESWEKR